ncbi:sugar kinase [Thioclava sp. JE_KL1]|uniref:sugar kinase n=1 Tax=Thioclava sp. JE_KL1 TaxID=2651187 RepID=UPI00128CB283|nr:sugar kinase [Thioclava sp. JE_KL1]MPQ94322.1 sugar kinase [Thioclava sp. JE_KL1]
MSENLKKMVAIGEAMLELAPVEGGTFRLGYAGDTFNTLWHAAQLLGSRARAGFVTRIGEDKLSGRFLAEMEADGLDISTVQRDAEREMGLYMIELEGAERSFHYWRQLSAARRLADDPDTLGRALSGADLVHVSGITLAILSPEARETLFDAIARARSDGARISFDPNYRPRLWQSPEEARDTCLRMLSHTDIALPSFDDEAALWGDATPKQTLERLSGQGVAEIAVKDGAQPVWYLAEGRTGRCDTPVLTELRDTTGAGDAFNAGYLASRLLGHPVEHAIGMGQTVGGAVLGEPGARLGKDAARALAASLE